MSIRFNLRYLGFCFMFGCAVLVAHGAAANCVPPVPHKEKVTLRAVHQPVANAQGRAMRGCILEIGEGR